jgi:hypothetical protein
MCRTDSIIIVWKLNAAKSDSWGLHQAITKETQYAKNN